ncbi:MAG TPA: YceI family protein [Candidatus Polarisedimenticolaceae bacterium]
MKLTTILAATAIAVSPALAAEYTIDTAHSGAHFTVRHMMVSNVKGDFAGVSGKVVWDGDPKTASVEATIDASTIDTGVDKRDEHLRSADFFDVAKYPTLTFKSRKVEAAGPGKLKVTGDLTLHGVTKEVVLDVEGPTAEFKNPWGKSVIGASASTTIKRTDFGLTWNKALETGGVLVGEDVKVSIELELVKSDSPAKASK